MQKFKWKVMLIAFLVSSALFFSGATLYEKYYRENPLEYDLTALEAVESVQINHSRRDVHVDVHLLYTENFPGLIREIEDILTGSMGKEYSFYVHDNRNEKLESFARELKPALYEGARKGNYRSVNETVISVAGKYAPDEYSFMVDNSFIYLQARDGDYFLYIFIPHKQEDEGGIK